MTEITIPKKNKRLTDTKKLLAIYNSEPILHQKILQIIALLFYVERKTDLVQGFARSTLRTADGKRLNFQHLNPIFSHLQEKKLLSNKQKCKPLVLHDIAVDALTENHAKANMEILQNAFYYKNIYEFKNAISLANIRVLNIATHVNDPQVFLNINLQRPENCMVFINELMNVFYPLALDPEWVKSRHPVIQLYLLCTKLYGFHANIDSTPPDSHQWISFIQKNDCIGMAIKNNLDKVLLLMSRLLQLSLAFKKMSYLEQYLPTLSDQYYYRYELQGALAFFDEDKKVAIHCYEKANKLYQSFFHKHEWFKDNLHSMFYLLALLHQDFSNDDLKKATAVIASVEKIDAYRLLSSIMNTLLKLKCNEREKAIIHFNNVQRIIEYKPTVLPFLEALCDWIIVLLEPEKLSELTAMHQEKFEVYRNIGHDLVAQIYAELIKLHTENDVEANYFFNELSPFKNFRFMNVLHVKQAWEYAIDQLQTIITNKVVSANQQTSVSGRRMVWLIDPHHLNIEVAEQTLRKNGTWSAGRPIALKRLYNMDEKLDYLTQYDQAAVVGLRREVYGWYNQEQYSWEESQTLSALIGHPLLFHFQNRDIPLELVKGTVELHVEKVDKGYHFSLSKYSTMARVFLEKETSNRYRVIDFTEEMVTICKILSEQGMTVPFQAKDKVIDMICNAKSTIHIQSDVADDDLAAIAGDTTPCAHLFPIQDGIKVNLWIRPFGEHGSYFRAGQGQRSIIATIQTAEGEQRKKVFRDFDKEKNSIQTLINQCATLAEFDEKTDEWYFNTLENSLELLLELEEYKKNNHFIIEWPKGQTLKVKQTVSSKNLSLSIHGKQHWFEYDGEVAIDEGRALDIKKLMELLDGSQGRFIPLANGEFIALTEKFKKQLEELRTLSDDNKVYHLSTSSLRGLAEDAGTLQEDLAWTKHLKKLSAMEKHQPLIPSTLQAELRDYQIEGFYYLSRLAHWEIGACLADDMGLGKTVQAIALLLAHAPKGPCLVVAPTSVCFVWLDELAKFAPTLVPRTLYNANDREALIQSLDKMDILICSYGLLHQAGDVLIEKKWQMIILDEAQAIKNPETKRWKYATQLNSQCRIAMTGTPIENHLGELWSIFRFLNPGLLGNLKFFQQRFSGPIERNNDPVAKRALKNLVSPYILRRTKSEVLLELPPKIEQSILIEPTPEETAFYEAVRVKALERISALNQAENNTKRFSILAEISRLRQACCHSSLVDENITISSSKLKTFVTLAKNIIDNKHKALIFSQFVRYLDKVREVLDEEKIAYQYLDGSTPIKERKRAVDDFQAGVGDLFLISLKAGGTGLNLTAADYVIILDPWWNPAVEDQAADRAHRMGQLRPVTVYRLIMKNSIEEKIITLHKNKKDLAADLLSGSDMAGKISEEELVGLIKG